MAIHQIYCIWSMWLIQGRFPNLFYWGILKYIHSYMYNPPYRGVTTVNIFLWTSLMSLSLCLFLWISACVRMFSVILYCLSVHFYTIIFSILMWKYVIIAFQIPHYYLNKLLFQLFESVNKAGLSAKSFLVHISSFFTR